MALLDEIVKKFLVPDRNNPTQNVEVHRYVIEKNEKPIAAVFGKFAPWSGKYGHGRLVELAKKHFDEIVIVSPTRDKSADPKVDIFTDEQKQKIIEKATGLRFIRVNSSIPIRMFGRIVEAGIKRPVLIVGPDRIEEFKKYFIEYSPDNKGIEDIKDKNFGKGEYFFAAERGSQETSGTKVRKALIDNDKETFLKLTGYDESFWFLMRDMLKNNKVVEKSSFRFDNFYYLTEGGNVTVRGETANKIPMDKITSKQFKEFQDEIAGTLKALNKEFEAKYKKPLFPNIDENIKSGKLFSGSTRTFFTMPYEEYSKYKKAVGDIDLQYPEELTLQLEEFLKSVEGKKFGKMTYFGQGGNSPSQENTIFRSSVAPDLVKNIQMDFEPVTFEKGVPTEFSVFSHYSSWEDIKVKVKGAFRSFLARSLVSAKEKLGDIAIMTPTGKISTSKVYNSPALRKFSEKGMRVAFEPVLDDRGNIQKTKEGKPIYREIPTSKSIYEKNLDDIFAFVFGKKPTPSEKHQFHSFIGMLKLMEKYLDKNMIKAVFANFMRIIWEKGQEIEQGEFDQEGIQVKDFEIKKAAYDQFIKVFSYLKMKDEALKKFVMPFYIDLKRKKLERVEKEKRK